jgi:hypothetical protein
VKAQLRDINSATWFAVMVVVFIGLGWVFKTAVLNGYVGTVFPVLALYAVPAAARRLRTRRGDASASAPDAPETVP